jgi:uncharacterized membrane protein YdjX (TVP38/TMEM64 family)
MTVPKKTLLLLLAVLLIAIFFWFDLDSYFTIDALKSRRAEFASSYAANPGQFLIAFFCAYVAVAALSFPGAAIMTLAAGALFGMVTGLILLSFASSIGAPLSFLSSRFLLRNWVQGKFGERLRSLNEGFERDGAFTCSRCGWCLPFHFSSSTC